MRWRDGCMLLITWKIVMSGTGFPDTRLSRLSTLLTACLVLSLFTAEVITASCLIQGPLPFSSLDARPAAMHNGPKCLREHLLQIYLNLVVTLSPSLCYLSLLTSFPPMTPPSDHWVLSQPGAQPIYLNKFSLDGSLRAISSVSSSGQNADCSR